MPTETTNAVIGIDALHRVVISYSNVVGTQYLTPAQARVMARAIDKAADMAEAAGN